MRRIRGIAALRAALVGIALLCLGATVAGAQQSRPPVVVELFTSQGCSSCPPADAYLGELARRDDLIALTFPVDYWDYLGWKDTLASPANSKRQRDYAMRGEDWRVYTPQMVVDGRIQAVGSRRQQVEQAIRDARDHRTDWVEVGLSARGDTVIVDIPARASAAPEAATVWLAMFQDRATVDIRRGENGGRSITYYNVVHQMMPVGRWTGERVEIELPKSDMVGQGYDGCAIILQRHGTGPIIGAALMESLVVR